MTTKFSQKYCLVQLITPLPEGYEFAMQDWPLHVTLADVFAIDGTPKALLSRLGEALTDMQPFSSTVKGEEWFGPERTVHVRLLERTGDLRKLHERCVSVLEEFAVVFNTPQYTHEGFRPHSTVRPDAALALGDAVSFHALTLIDMFPEGDPTKRRVVGTIAIGDGAV